jgi:hypothetical protein
MSLQNFMINFQRWVLKIPRFTSKRSSKVVLSGNLSFLSEDFALIHSLIVHCHKFTSWA